MQNSIPVGWQTKSVDELTTFIEAGFSCNKAFEKVDGYVHLRTHNISVNGRLDFSTLVKIDEEKVDYKKSSIEKGDILFNNTNSKELVGKTAYVNENFEFGYSNHLTKIKVTQEILPAYLVYYFNYLHSQGYFQEICNKWVGQAGINSSTLKQIEIKYPPVPEQQGLIDKLDNLFSKIDKAIALSEVNVKYSKHLTTSVLNEVFTSGVEEFGETSLVKHVNFIGGSQPPKQDFSYEFKDGYVRLIQIRDYKSDEHLVYIKSNSTKKFCNETDVMIGRYGPPVFQILRGLSGAYNVALMKAVPDENYITKDYLYWFLQNPNIQNYIIGISQRSAGQSGVNKVALEKYTIPVPPLDVQNEISAYLDSISVKQSILAKKQKRRLKELKVLKASILDAAFKGELSNTWEALSEQSALVD